MSQSPRRCEELRDQEYREASENCTTLVKKLETWHAMHLEAEIRIHELSAELVRVRNKVEEIEADRRSFDSSRQTAARMVCTIEEAIGIIDELITSGIDLPVSVGMHLERLQSLPDHAGSDVAASAYKHLVAAALAPEHFAKLDRIMRDVITLALGRNIDASDISLWKKERDRTFGNILGTVFASNLGNSYHQMFKRDFIRNPMKADGARQNSTDERGRRTRRRQQYRPKKTRCISQPISESGSMTGNLATRRPAGSANRLVSRDL